MRRSRFEVGVHLRHVLAGELNALQFAALAEFAAQIEHQPVELIRRNANGDRAFHLAVGQLVAVDRGDERTLDPKNEFGDRRGRGVERFNLELHVAGPNDDPLEWLGGRFRVLRIGVRRLRLRDAGFRFGITRFRRLNSVRQFRPRLDRIERRVAVVRPTRA